MGQPNKLPSSPSGQTIIRWGLYITGFASCAIILLSLLEIPELVGWQVRQRTSLLTQAQGPRYYECPAKQIAQDWLLREGSMTQAEVADRFGPCGAEELEGYRNRTDYHFVGLGVQKGGTTALYMRLVEHPSLPGGSKETLFFFEDVLDDMPRKQAKKYFLGKHYNGIKNVDKGHRRGEMTPEYQCHPFIAKRVKHVLGRHLRFISILREPVSRAYSYFQMVTRLGNPKGRVADTFEATIEKEYKLLIECIGTEDPHWYRDCYLKRYIKEASVNKGSPVGPLGYGFYYYHFFYWFHVFQPCNFLVLESEDLKTPGIEQCMFLFLDAKPYNFHVDEKNVPIKEGWIQSHLYKENDPIDPRTEAMLRDMYKPFIGPLEDLLGRKFPSWGYGG
ncbi:unnamed protein product [Choristocarpus tenellus]